jgi:hypothetical protein
MSRNSDLLMKVKHVESDSLNLKVYLQKIGLIEKVKQVKE